MNYKGILFFILFFFTSNILISQKNIHDIWDSELKKYVDKEGNVNYRLWKKNSKLLETYLINLENNPPINQWTKNDSLAYFINAYNAVTVKLILDNYPLRSIKDLIIPWWLKRFKLNSEKITLNFIEHKILRKMDDPRIHFAINCASRSCPKLQNVAYYSHKLENQLNDAASEFINDQTKNKINVNHLMLSKIFSWFKDDFGNRIQLLKFVNKYSKIKILENARIEYLNYDWNLNEKLLK